MEVSCSSKVYRSNLPGFLFTALGLPIFDSECLPWYCFLLWHSVAYILAALLYHNTLFAYYCVTSSIDSRPLWAFLFAQPSITGCFLVGGRLYVGLFFSFPLSLSAIRAFCLPSLRNFSELSYPSGGVHATRPILGPTCVISASISTGTRTPL